MGAVSSQLACNSFPLPYSLNREVLLVGGVGTMKKPVPVELQKPVLFERRSKVRVALAQLGF